MSVIKKKASGTASTTSIELDFTCSASESVGEAVYISGNGAVSKADKSSISTAKVVGFISSKPTSTTCKVRLNGLLSGLTGISFGEVYFLDTNGTITTTPPTTGVLSKVGLGYNTTSIVINIDNNYTIL